MHEWSVESPMQHHLSKKYKLVRPLNDSVCCVSVRQRYSPCSTDKNQMKNDTAIRLHFVWPLAIAVMQQSVSQSDGVPDGV